MQPTSLLFIFYCLPAIIAVYYFLSYSRQQQNDVLLLCGLLLYACGEPLLAVLLAVSILVNWFLARTIEKWNDTKELLAGSLANLAVFLNLALLFASCYTGLVTGTIKFMLGVDLNYVPPPFPLGVPVFTLLAISYIMDVRRGTAAAMGNPVNAGLYICFFPLMFAGPVVQYSEIAEQITSRSGSWELFSSGCQRFVIGLAKKVLLVDVMWSISDRIFNLSTIMPIPAMLAFLGVLAFALYIYFLFSSYADMAIGLGRMFGFTIKENFNYPYFAVSMTDFWNRWNISAVNWFNVYVFQPLRRKRMHDMASETPVGALYGRDLMTVWILFGLWSGPGWTFLVWGAVHGTLLLFENLVPLQKLNLPVAVKRLYVFTVLTVTWVFFRANDINQATTYLHNLSGMNYNGFYSDLAVLYLKENWVYFLAAITLSLPIFPKTLRLIDEKGLTWLNKGITIASPFVLFVIYAISATCLIQGWYLAARLSQG